MHLWNCEWKIAGMNFKHFCFCVLQDKQDIGWGHTQQFTMINYGLTRGKQGLPWLNALADVYTSQVVPCHKSAT